MLINKMISKVFLLLGFAIATSCQSPNTNLTQCCHAEFAALGSDPDFRNKHETPQTFWREDSLGRTETFVTPDGKTGSAYWVRNPRSEKYLLVFHEWWGLNEHIKQMADNFANELMVNVMAVDLYDGKVATSREEAAKLMQENKVERSQAIIKGALNLMDAKAKVATVGWCFGGGWSLQAAILASKKSTACVMYYGMPETDIRKLKTLKADVLNIVALKDQWITPQITAQFETNMKAASKSLTVKAYDADHAFANPSNPNHNADFAADAFAQSLKFIKERW
jgi:carboxymethylenebutenolidase